MNAIWNEKIKEGKTKVGGDAFEDEMEKLKDKLKRKETGGIHSFLKRKKQSQENLPPPTLAPNHEETTEVEDLTTNDDDLDDSDDEEDPLTPEPSKPAQDKIKEEIAKVEKVLCNLIESRNLGLQEVGSASFLSKQIKDTKQKKDDLEKEEDIHPKSFQESQNL